MPPDTQFHAGYSTIPALPVLRQLEKESWRNGFVSDSVRARLAFLIRALREQRDWSQADLGRATGKPQSNISKFEDPDYGKYSLTTLFEFAAAYGLPLYIDMPEWEDWFRLIADQSKRALHRTSFDLQRLASLREQEIAARSLAEIFGGQRERTPVESLGKRLESINATQPARDFSLSPLGSGLGGALPPANDNALHNSAIESPDGRNSLQQRAIAQIGAPAALKLKEG